MNDEVITDLKQFITVTVTQALSEQITEVSDRIDELDIALNGRIDGLDTKFSQKIDDLDDKVSQKLDDIMGMVGDALYDSNETNGSQLKNHERRIRRLEKKLTSN